MVERRKNHPTSKRTEQCCSIVLPFAVSRQMPQNFRSKHNNPCRSYPFQVATICEHKQNKHKCQHNKDIASTDRDKRYAARCKSATGNRYRKPSCTVLLLILIFLIAEVSDEDKSQHLPSLLGNDGTSAFLSRSVKKALFGTIEPVFDVLCVVCFKP
eukprot:GILK01010108.1.p2 GENE.GILK01010108.1~~GILK01010108.1.p2  ORF type:complete len:157 (-),score=8.63 GILK01010108.1:164-634(-)